MLQTAVQKDMRRDTYYKTTAFRTTSVTFVLAMLDNREHKTIARESLPEMQFTTVQSTSLSRIKQVQLVLKPPDTALHSHWQKHSTETAQLAKDKTAHMSLVLCQCMRNCDEVLGCV